MSRPFPYTFISCPCVDTPVFPRSHLSKTRDSPHKSARDQSADIDDEEEEKTFDPRSPRSNYSLYPIEQLLYCEDCHRIKCPRCITEEIVSWYCPNCLFETPSSTVRGEENRCARNCFNCPVCTAPLAVTALEDAGQQQQATLVLACGYCLWTTLDIGITFDKPTNIRAQLSKKISSARKQTPVDYKTRFEAQKSFYRSQIAETSSSPAGGLGSDFGAGFSSPSALNRIMSLYASSSRLSSLYGAGKKPKSKPPIMREALTAKEGLKITSPDEDDIVIQKMASDECGWDGLASMEQRAFQSPGVRFVDDLLPLPVLLRTKRAKRCKSCKHILVKPEFKPQSTRFRIRLIALSYIPLPTLRPLVLPPQPGSPPSALDLNALPPQRPIQFLLTLKNHMFDAVKITLATPSVTSGRVASKVTILCPEFDIGVNSDAWEEALQAATAQEQHRLSRPVERVAEAGKVWDKGRNWTTVVLEVVPDTLPEDGFEADEDVLEIPVFVRMEWDAESQMESSTPAGKASDTVKKELAYWMVLGVGRISSLLAGQ